MNVRMALAFVLGPSVILGAGCGSSNGGTAGDSGSPSSESTQDGQSGAQGQPGADDSSSSTASDATTSSDADTSAGGGDDADGSGKGSSDSGKRGADATAADAGQQPFKGLAGNSTCSELGTMGVSWWYNWETGPNGCTGTPFVPMVWGHTGNEQSTKGIASEVSSAASAGYSYVLGFNEPDNTSQSDISVATAISLWPSFKSSSLLVGSPATQGNSAGLTWIQDFMTQVNADKTGTLQVDFIATHWYGWNTGSCDAKAANLESWIKGIEAIPGDRPIWLTEWGCLNDSNPDEATVKTFYAGAIAMFAKHPRLERYAWYQFETNNELMNSDGGGPTSLGTAFAAAPALR